MSACATCGQELPAPAADAPAEQDPAEAGLLGLLTPDERDRGVRALHELSHDRQVAVKAVLTPSPAQPTKAKEHATA